jgi:hypothetical protein
MGGASTSTLHMLPWCEGVMFNEMQGMSSWCGTWLSTGTTLPFNIQNIGRHYKDHRNKKTGKCKCITNIHILYTFNKELHFSIPQSLS